MSCLRRSLCFAHCTPTLTAAAAAMDTRARTHPEVPLWLRHSEHTTHLHTEQKAGTQETVRQEFNKETEQTVLIS